MGNVHAGEYGVGDACGWRRRGEEVLWVKGRRFQCVLHGQSCISSGARTVTA